MFRLLVVFLAIVGAIVAQSDPPGERLAYGQRENGEIVDEVAIEHRK